MSHRIILIDHPSGNHRDDRLSALLARRGYDLCWICPGNGDPLPGPSDDYLAAVVYGGPESANDDRTHDYIAQEIQWVGDWVKAGKPYLGICLGGQILARALGAAVRPHPDSLHEIGYRPVMETDAGAGFLNGVSHVYHWHKEGFELADGVEPLARGDTFANQAFRYGAQKDAKVFGLQFHPEVTPAIMARWISEAGESLEMDGADSAARQQEDADAYDRPLWEWLRRFLSDWLEG